MKNCLKLIFLIAALAAFEYAFPAQITADVAQTAGKNFLAAKNIEAVSPQHWRAFSDSVTRD